MVVGIKDIFKMIGIFVISACAVLVCTLFLNYNMDLKAIESLMTNELLRGYYDALTMTGTVVCAVTGGCLLLTSVVMLVFYIKHYIDIHRRELGILKALGYSNWRIAGTFWVFGLSIFVGTVIGYLGAHGMMPLFYSVQNEDHLIPEVVLHFHPLLAVYLVVLPTAFFALLSVLYSYLKLKSPVLDLLRGKAENKRVHRKEHRVHSRKNMDAPFLQELRKNTLRQRKTLVFFIAFASFCYSAMMQMSASMKDLSSELMGAMMLGIGIVLAWVTLFLAITTVINANTKTIAMMRVFGYPLKECSQAILGGYRPVAYVGFAVGTVYQYALLRIMVSIVFKDVEGVPEYSFDVPMCVITLISFAVIYEIIMYCYSMRIGKVSVKEVMLE